MLVIGRAMDLLRLMRAFRAVRKIVGRTEHVSRAVLGPLILLATSVHVFVYCGMLLWGGSITVGQTQGVPPFYDLNNFNTYPSGVLTMFNILIVNDWYAIAGVFLTVSARWVVFSYFIIANLFLVCTILNVITAFFVGGTYN